MTIDRQIKLVEEEIQRLLHLEQVISASKTWTSSASQTMWYKHWREQRFAQHDKLQSLLAHKEVEEWLNKT
jgi:hypothetical protein